MLLTDEKVIKRGRRYYPETLDITSWDNVEACLNELLDAEINSVDELIVFLEKFSELQMLISQEQGVRYVKMTCNTENEEYAKLFNDYFNNVAAKAQPYNNKIDLKFQHSPFKEQLPPEKYNHLKRIISNRTEVFRDENVPLTTKEMELSNRYSALISQMTAYYDGKEQTLAQLSRYLQDNNRQVRQEVWQLRYDRLAQDADQLDEIFEELKALRIRQAKNAGFSTYRDYKHKEMGRFSYSPEDVQQFHKSVEKAVLPFLREVTAERKEQLNLPQVKPYDTGVETDGRILKPFETIDQFIDKGISILHRVNPKYGINLNKMKNSGLLDLENRKGKSPGGYNYPLRELGSSFIMMNAVGVHRDVVTLLHEAGHAMHSFATRPLHLMDYKECPHESAELASMAMEMLTMEYWNEYYPDPDDLLKATKDQLVKTLQFLPWCMIVDAFQQWIYTNPEHTPQQRSEYFASLVTRFDTGIDWSGLEREQQLSWMFQLHVFKYPFYYVEYGIAQLASLAIYKNYREHGRQAVRQYDDFLIEGYSKPLDELYRTAGIKFDFSEAYITELTDFVRKEIEVLQ